MAYKRIFGLVMDSVGAGTAPDSVKYGDDGADTLGHVGHFYAGKLALPNLAKLGLSNLHGTPLTPTPTTGGCRKCPPGRTRWTATGK